jgi:hypothetical protein
MMQGRLKIQAFPYSTRYRCYDVVADPAERRDLGEAACAPLPELAQVAFDGVPGAMPRRRRPVEP